jgi:hypothetical protein
MRAEHAEKQAEKQADTQEGGSGKVGEAAGAGVGAVSASLPLARLEAGDIVVFPASSPPPAHWMHGARLRQALSPSLLNPSCC